MEKTDLVLGIDTSCYTTSAALMDGTGALLFDERRLLRVKEGRRGLSQSEMVFSICGPCQIFWNASISHRDGFLPLSLPSGQDHSRNPICLPFGGLGHGTQFKSLHGRASYCGYSST